LKAGGLLEELDKGHLIRLPRKEEIASVGERAREPMDDVSVLWVERLDGRAVVLDIGDERVSMRVLQGVGGPLKERHEALISPHEELSEPTAGDNRAVVARAAGGLLSVSLDGAANHPPGSSGAA
jgi:hypothetical protein